MKQNFRNPLGLAFGLACRNERKTLNITIESLAEKLNIKPSFYKLVENGTNYLHTNKTPNIVQAFPESMHLDGVSKMLWAISHTEATARSLLSAASEPSQHQYVEGFLLSVKQLATLDPDKFGRLFLPYQNAELVRKLATAPAKEAKTLLEHYGLVAQAQDFLKRYEDFGQLENGLQPNALISKLESVPSMYLDMLADLVNRFSSLPARVGFEEMWRWDKENLPNFQEWWCIFDLVESIVSENNLSRCHYDMLWQKDFDRARILFIEHEETASVNNRFRSILRSVHEKSAIGDCPPEKQVVDVKHKLKTFDEVIDKAQLLSLPAEPSPELQQLQAEIVPAPHSAFWVYKLTDNSLVGFYAKVTGRDHPVPNMLTEGVSLDHKQTVRKLDLLKKLWEKCERLQQ